MNALFLSAHTGLAWLKSPRGFGIVCALFAILLTAVYVFFLCPYSDFLYSDAGAFWRRAGARLSGDEFNPRQYMAWPTAYHIFLAEFFRLMRTLGLLAEMKLEVALAVNMFFFGLSVYAFHQIAGAWFDRPAWARTATLLYALGFPSLYFQAFLLSENLASPLLVIATWIFISRSGWSGTLGAALVMGLAVIIRPAFGPFGLAFVAYYFVRYGWSRTFLARSAVFSLLFFAVVGLMVRENLRISGGKVAGLSANAGVDFFIAMSQVHRVDLRLEKEDLHWFIVVPSQSLRPGQGTFHTQVPFYEQGHYFQLGFEALKRNPRVLIDNIGQIRNLFFCRMYPTRLDAPGFTGWMPLYDGLKFGMFLLCGFYFCLWRRMGDRLPMLVLLGGMPLLTCLLVYFFTGEPRYSYAIIFSLYLLALKVAEIILPEWRLWIRPARNYAFLIGLASLGTFLYIRLDKTSPDTLQIALYPPVKENESPPSPARWRFETARLRFPYSLDGFLRHATYAHRPIDEAARLIAGTQVHGPTEGIHFQLEVVSGYPFEIWMDEERIWDWTPENYFVPVIIDMYLDKKPRHVRFVCYYEPKPGGFTVNYSIPDPDIPYRYPWGVSSPWLNFTPLREIKNPKP